METDPNPLIAMEQELESLRAQRAMVEAKIEVLIKAILILRPLYGEPVSYSLSDLQAEMKEGLKAGVTDQVRAVLKGKHPTWMPPTTIRDYLEKRGVLRSYTNPMAVIHQVLRRLEEQDEIEVTTMADGGKAYRWMPVPPVPRPSSIASMIAEMRAAIPKSALEEQVAEAAKKMPGKKS